ncbi:MAG: flagellar export chaperone FliS [Helicobacter sp.]|uniref:flagellar export chaperone FliS n=1 Tax=Helicobacter sp. 10-6591 TaxID=2004998 RepID=UPI000DCE75C8|nr:flagellar export chaperone FliS [Helicobacter sp. 10-6591]MCI7485659.1 flagellar export chaperone FliS [Helicobacter sp.]MDD7567757.1 flagellar export chaperone FliS [Helicobacter sp.]MDY5740887.1 flagellar export chaperone FliS [Helicobacter sp.]RAX54591.1 flagellar export chaperone FliS [Helicobacter sp. 10-6591]
MRSNAYDLYQQNAVMVESPVKLVEMLYEGILRFCTQAKRNIESGDIEKKIYYINRVTDIFTELLNTLDYEKGGDVADYLAGLYTYQIKLLTQANVTNDVSKIDIVLNVAQGLLEAWREVNSHELLS